MHKVFAGRNHDWLDVEGVLVRNRVGLDRALIGAELAPLLAAKGAMHNLERLDQLFEQLGNDPAGPPPFARRR